MVVVTRVSTVPSDWTQTFERRQTGGGGVGWKGMSEEKGNGPGIQSRVSQEGPTDSEGDEEGSES